MHASSYGRYNHDCATLALKTHNAAQDTGTADPNNNSAFPAMHRLPTQLPDPWLFDSEKLIRALDRCREQVVMIPCNGDVHATHFGINLAISAIWNLREQLRRLLHLRRDGQREFAKKASSAYTNQHEPRTHKQSLAGSSRRHTSLGKTKGFAQ